MGNLATAEQIAQVRRCARQYGATLGLPAIAIDALEACAQAAHMLNRLELACRQEHGGKRDEAECPICEALRAIDSQSAGEAKQLSEAELVEQHAKRQSGDA